MLAATRRCRHGHKVDRLFADAAHDPLRTILNVREPVVSAGLVGVADEDALLVHGPRDHAGIQLARIEVVAR